MFAAHLRAAVGLVNGVYIINRFRYLHCANQQYHSMRDPQRALIQLRQLNACVRSLASVSLLSPLEPIDQQRARMTTQQSALHS
jgi:hypothetical protein